MAGPASGWPSGGEELIFFPPPPACITLHAGGNACNQNRGGRRKFTWRGGSSRWRCCGVVASRTAALWLFPSGGHKRFSSSSLFSFVFYISLFSFPFSLFSVFFSFVFGLFLSLSLCLVRSLSLSLCFLKIPSLSLSFGVTVSNHNVMKSPNIYSAMSSIG